MHDDDIPGYLLDALRAAQTKGLKHLLAVQIGETEKMWQVSTRFRTSAGFHIAIERELTTALLKVLDPPLEVSMAVAAAAAAASVAEEPADLKQERREDRDEQDDPDVYDGVKASDLIWKAEQDAIASMFGGDELDGDEGGLFD